MRSLILAATLSLTSLVTPTTADACGGYYSGPRAPALYLVSAHHDGEHSFVMLNDEFEPKEHQWRVLDPMSFDRTAIAPAPDFTGPVEFMLLGPTGTKKVSTRTRVFIDDAMAPDHKPMFAAQIPGGRDFRVAVWSAHDSLAWRDLGNVERTKETAAWAKRLGVDPGSAFMAREGDTEMLTYWNAKTRAYNTEVRHRGAFVGTVGGTAIGVITADGLRYVVSVYRNQPSTLRLPTATATPRR